jgi:hypothetical protein
MWSCRCWPTPGRSCCTGTPWRCNCVPSPMPDSISSCGDCSAPALSSTSRRAFSCRVSPPWRYSTPTARRPSISTRVEAHAFLVLAVEVGVQRIAGLCRGFHEVGAVAVGAGRVHHVQRAAAAVQAAGATLVVLGLQEVGQHRVEAPAGIALGGPVLVVFALAADVDHRVHRTRAAQCLAARLVAAAPVQAGLRHGLEAPVGEAGLAHQREAGRAVDQHAGVAFARFEQAHRDGRVFAEARRQHAAGRAAADDDVVEQCRLPGAAGARAHLLKRTLVAAGRRCIKGSPVRF